MEQLEAHEEEEVSEDEEPDRQPGPQQRFQNNPQP